MNPPLTQWQESTLERAAEESPDAKVVGWDDAAKGPLLNMGGVLFAISPRGRLIDRGNKEAA